MTPAEFVDAALIHVESTSIRQWVNTENNRPIWNQIAEQALARARARNIEPDLHNFAAYIVATAIGL